MVAEGIAWQVSPRRGLGAWAWPGGRIEVSRALIDRLDDEQLAAALAHELGHLLDGGHLHGDQRMLRRAAEVASACTPRR
jgi:Zn-dependent protease with chaperone function